MRHTDGASPPASTALRCAIIDDDLRHTEALTRVLNVVVPGCEIASASDGLSGAALVETFHPHMVITDHDMPGLDGSGLCEKIRARRELRGTKIIVVSGKLDKSAQERLEACGADLILCKPISAAVLTSALRLLLKR